MSDSVHPEAVVATGHQKTATARPPAVWGMLLVRLALALAFQALFALGFTLAGDSDPWRTAANWWLGSFALGEMVNLLFLTRLARREGLRYRSLLRPGRSELRSDLRWLALALLVAGPVGFLPSQLLAQQLWGDPQIGADLIFRAVPVLAAWSMVLVFPIIHALTELPTYFGYVMPRWQALNGGRWVVPWLVCSLTLAAQHMFLPLLFDWRFILWRLLAYLPLALWFGWIIRSRPTLLLYLVVAHGILDLSLPILVLRASIGGG